MPYNTGYGVEKSMDPGSRTRAWTQSVLILRGLWYECTVTPPEEGEGEAPPYGCTKR